MTGEGWSAPSRAVVGAALRALRRAFGPLDPPRRTDPLDELVLTVLSQNTSDANSFRAFADLRARFPRWTDVVQAAPEAVADAIRPGGLANVKGPRIQAILREVGERASGEPDLEWMRDAPDQEVETYLTSLPGVGPKTAACVLAFSLGRPALPVDTHVFRTATRLGWLPPRTDAAAAHRLLRQVVPPKLRVAVHVGLIRLGREICRPGRPRCEDCPLQRMCPTAPSFLGGRAPSSG